MLSVENDRSRLILADCLDALREMPDSSIDSIVTDPPYGLSFMGKRWDYDVPSVEIWAECLRVLKPGGHLLAFAGSRTQHRMAVRIEDAEFEIRDMIAWVYGCLDEATEVATENGVMPYHKTKVGDLVLCYDVEHGEYTYQPILEVVEYDYSDTAYRLVGDSGEQVVSRNHRVIVERGGSEAFQLAETLEREACVPVLESLPALRQALHDARSSASGPQQNVQRGVQGCANRIGECGGDAAEGSKGRDDQVRRLRGERLEACGLASQGGGTNMQQTVQRHASWRGVGDTCSYGSSELVGRVRGGLEGAHDGRVESRMEGWADLSESEGCVCGSADQVRALPGADAADGAVGRLCDGAPAGGCAGDQPTADEIGVRAPHQPRRDGQPTGKPDVVCDERATQGVRAWSGHRSAVVRVVPFHYTGKVWCLRVPTGAFVAVRNGVAFPTGNSGFPKSMDVSKAIDRAAGAEREIIGEKMRPDGKSVLSARSGDESRGDGWDRPWRNDPGAIARNGMETAPATEAARQWQGWGTALKPALETVTFASKPYTQEQERDIILSNLIRLEARLWLLSSASAAEESSTSNPSEYGAACAIAQWSADEITNIRAALCGQMDTSLFELATNTSLSIVSSWRCTLVESWSDGNTSTIETKSSTTTDLRTLKFSLSQITHESIIKACGLPGGFSANATTAESHFNASLSLLQSIRTLSATEPAISQAQHEHLGADVKPNLDPCIMARKPLTGTVAANVLAHGTGALNIDGCRIGFQSESDKTAAKPGGKTTAKSGNLAGKAQDGFVVAGPVVDGERLYWSNETGWGSRDGATIFQDESALDPIEATGREPATQRTEFAAVQGAGRWPANLIHDGSKEVAGLFPQTGKSTGGGKKNGDKFGGGYAPPDEDAIGYGDAGSAARFFYCAKASKKDRGEGNAHPTVKPTELMRYLCRLVTPPGGAVLDPYMGSGSTGKAAMLEGFRFIGIEKERESFDIATARIKRAQEGAAAEISPQSDLFAAEQVA